MYCASSSGLARDNDVAPPPARVDDIASQQGDAPRNDRASNAVDKVEVGYVNTFDVGLSNKLVEAFVGADDRAPSQVPVAPLDTPLGQAQMLAFNAQAQTLTQNQQENDDSTQTVANKQRPVDIKEHAEALIRLSRKHDTPSMNHPADGVAREIRQFWEDRGEDGDMLQKEATEGS